jgi:membrane associated rhomboid family serine protease
MSLQWVNVLGPIVGMQAAVPTLHGRRYPWHLRLSAAQLDSLVFRESDLASGRWWTALTSAFVHYDDTHLFENMASLASFAPAVVAEHGAGAFLFTFLGGSAASCLGTDVRRQQLRALFSARRPMTGLSSLDSALARLAEGAADTAQQWSRYAGASVGVCAVLGLHACSALRRLTYDARAAWGLDDAGGGGSAAAAARRRRVQPMDIVQDGFVVARAVHVVAQAVGALAQGDGWQQQQQQLLLQQGAHTVDHGGHLIGFAFGVACFCAGRWLVPSKRSKAKKKRPWG